jgi:hypothetical protein
MFVGPVLQVGTRVKRVFALANKNQDVVLVLLQDARANERVMQPIARRRVDDLRSRAGGVDKELKLGICHETLLSKAAIARHLPFGLAKCHSCSAVQEDNTSDNRKRLLEAIQTATKWVLLSE